MGRRPIIGISGPERGGFPAWLFTSWAVRLAGGKPVRITPARSQPDRLDALIVGGGADVHPVLYGGSERPHAAAHRQSRSWGRLMLDYAIAPLVYLLRWLFGLKRSESGLDHARDELELSLIGRAERGGLPVLGICRGAQLLNVYAGGTLHQDLSTFYAEEPSPWTVFPRKTARVEPDSRLAEALGATRCDVNSLHRQAIDDVGGDLRVVAHDRRGVVQAIEVADRPFWIGVQWHPEYMPQVWEQRRLLRRIVDEARSYSTTPSMSSQRVEKTR